MNINKLIISTLSFLNIPITYLIYSGSESTYITFFESNNYGEDYSDDIEEIEVHSIQIDLFTKKDPKELEKKINEALKNKFSGVEYQELYESDTKLHHICFRCYFYEFKEE